jgi:deoxyhypusine synthase
VINVMTHMCVTRPSKQLTACNTIMLLLALSNPASALPWLQMIARLGQAINHPDSVYYWAWKNNIPVFCPAITDGSIGDMLFFHSYKSPGLVVDVVGDIRAINDSAMRASPRRTGMIILGGGALLTAGLVCFAG